MKNQPTMLVIKPGIPVYQHFLLGVFLFLFILVSSCTPEKNIESNSTEKLLGAGLGISGATLIVQNIDSTKKYFTEKLGFSIPPFGGFNESTFTGTKSVFIPFPDLSSLEILAVDDTVQVADQPSFINSYLEKGEGVRTYSLSSSSVNETKLWLKNKGLKTDSVRAHYAEMNRGEESLWKQSSAGMYSLNFDTLDPPPHLPRFEEIIGFEYQMMKDDWKIPFAYGRSFMKHPNGVVGIKTLQILVENMDSVKNQFHIMGLEELESDEPNTFARFKIKDNQELHLFSPVSPEDELTDLLKEKGPGVFAINFEVMNLDSTRAYMEQRLAPEAMVMDTASNQLRVLQKNAYGVQLEFSQEPEERTMLAQKLKMGPNQDSMTSAYAAELYGKYCQLCHGKERVGYAADYAPSLRSHSLLASSKNTNFLRYTIQYGRANTAMAGYLLSQGGPLSLVEIEIMLQWLEESSGVKKPLELSREPVKGDVELGNKLYHKKCASCHGNDGEGVVGPALGNPMLLATATDEFLRYAITEGRDNTLMPAFKDSLSSDEINALTAFLRSRASGWDVPKVDSFSVPKPENYVLNPANPSPEFKLREGRFVSAKQVLQALEDSARIVLLDARSTVAWRQTHIPGSIPVPYYEAPDTFLQYIPNDDNTWIVTYCACPHAASGQVVDKLNQKGYNKTAIIDEGILIWAQLGYPVVHGE